MDLSTLEEQEIPSPDRSMDIRPVWLGDDVYFLSDRDFYMNVWAWNEGKGLRQVTHGTEGDIKWLTGYGSALVYERGGYLYSLDLASGKSTQLTIAVHGDFPWAEPHWENVTKMIADASLSPTGKRILIEARGDIFTVPV